MHEIDIIHQIFENHLHDKIQRIYEIPHIDEIHHSIIKFISYWEIIVKFVGDLCNFLMAETCFCGSDLVCYN